MKSKVKKRCKQMLTGLLALSMLCGLLPQNTVNVSAATTAKTTVSSYGRLGTVDVGSKTKSGTWWKINVGSKTAFCLSLGKTCHTGNTYQVTDTHTWNQNTGGEKHGYYAKIIRFYVNDCNRAKKAFVLGQALIWAVSEGNTSEANLKNVIKQVKANTGYFPNKTVADLYKQIFQPSGTWEAKATMWEKTGATKGYQKLITVDADILQNPNYKTITDHTYYRQRITLHKQDEDGKGLGGIKFTLSADNLDDLYSFNVFDRNGDTTSNADEDDNTEFEVSGLTTDGGTVAWRMTYRLEADEMAYYTDAALANMNADQKKAAKEVLEDDGYKQGIHFGKNMTKAEAEDLIKKDLNSQIKDISNTYTLTEDSIGNNKNIFLDPAMVKGVKITLKEANSWQKNSNGDWPDKLVEHPTQYSKAYMTTITNKYKKATIEVTKKSGGSADGSAHGDATLDGAVFQLYSDKACTQKAKVFDAAGNAKTAGVYRISGGKLTTDYLRSGNTYYLKEIQAPTGFLLSDEVKELKIDASAKTDEFTPILFQTNFADTPIKGKIAVKKKSYDPTKKEYYPENNTTFQVYLKSKGSYDNCADDERATIKTDADGYAVTGDLVYGTYVVHQVDSGDVDAYYVDDFEANVTENGKVYEFEKVNELFKAYFKIIKKDKNTEKTVLKPGTSYQIYQVVDGKGVEFTSECGGITGYTMDEDGTIHVLLPLGKYKMKETNTPYGYVYPEAKEWSLEFKWQDGEDEYVLNSTDATDDKGLLHIKNDFAGTKLELIKQDAKTKESIEGAQFGLYSKHDIYNYAGEKIVDAGTQLATLTTGADGSVVSDKKLPLMSELYTKTASAETASPMPTNDVAGLKLNSGDYYLQELSVSDSYYMDTTPINIHLEYQDAETRMITAKAVKENTQTTNVVSKVDVTGSKEVDGCKLEITDASGKKVISWTSGDKDSVKVYVTEKDGYQNFKYSFDNKGNLLVGGLFHDKEYTLTETRPADGYVTADAITYQIKSVMASSVAENPTDTVASGSAVTVKPVSGSAVSGETGISYTSVVAMKQKDGTFADHTDDKIIMVDEQTHIQLLKLDKETGQALGGAKFVVTDSKGNKVMKFVTKDDAYDITGKLVVGETYTFTEVSAPSGYQLAKPVQLTIKDTGKVQTVTVKDAPIPEVPDTPQTGGNMPVIPIAAGLLTVVGAVVIIWKKRAVVKK
ncbi:MAG: SpaA isopeptide-forming pilin-related protein [Clostridium sp.]